MPAILKIKTSGITTKRIPVNKVKEACEIINNLPEDLTQTFIYSTVNQITRIENTITLRKNNDSNRIR